MTKQEQTRKHTINSKRYLRKKETLISLYKKQVCENVVIKLNQVCITFLFLSIIIFSCESKQNKIKQIDKSVKDSYDTIINNTKSNDLYTVTWTGIVKDIEGVKVIKDSVKKNNSTYFEIGLYIMGDYETYTAEKKIVKPVVGRDFKSVSLNITDKDGNILNFKSSTDFLNFMSECNYEIVAQTKYKYYTEYTFKRR